jgi:septal ring factor EnvC (AmiA/AmiB activator)
MMLDRQVAEHNQRLAQLASDQARIREDMKTVSQSTPYYQRLLSKLNDQESAIEKLQQERDDLATRRDAQQKEFADFVAGLDVG